MHEVDIQEIVDYAKCPMYYFFKYKAHNLKTEYISLMEKYDEDIHKVIYFVFSRVQEGAGIDVKDIKFIWGKSWIKDKRKANIMFNESLMTKDIYNEKRKKGLYSLLNFQETFSKSLGYPIAVNKEYKIQISKHLTVKGRFELIRENENKEIEIITFKTDEHSYSKVVKDHDLKLLCSGLAAREYIKSQKITHVLYNVDKNSFSIHEDDELNVDFFKYNINNIFKGIYNKLYYMGPDTNCQFCQYKTMCSKRSNVMSLIDKEAKKW